MPLFAVIVTCLFCPVFLEKWYLRKLYCCYNSLISSFDKFCRSLGCRCPKCTIREDYFDNDTDIESLIKNVQDIQSHSTDQNWKCSSLYFEFKTTLNTVRTKVGLEARNFFISRHFLNNKYGELLAVLTIDKNTAKMQAYYRGDWEHPKNKKKSKPQHPDYSIMPV